MLPLALRLCKGVTHLTCALLSGSYNTSMMGPLITDRSINQSVCVCVCLTTTSNRFRVSSKIFLSGFVSC